MKQNTKFIWIYGAILFSFALILIVFAGLTQQEDAHENEKLSHSVSSLSRDNATLAEQKLAAETLANELQAQLTVVTDERNTQYAEKEAALLAYGGDIEVTRVLVQAYREKAGGNLAQAKQTISALNAEDMTEAQKYVYKSIIGE